MPEITLPLENGSTRVRIERACPYRPPAQPLRSRIAYAAAHVVSTPDGKTIDWEATLAYRRHLWSYGLGVAEAMDTSQRGMGLPWMGLRGDGACELIAHSLSEAEGLIACGAGTDQLPEDEPASLGQIIAAYEEQCEWIENRGGRVILMASRALARTARSAEDYFTVYSRILLQLRRPAILHWLGEMFDPKLAGYWGARETGTAMNTCLHLIQEHYAQIDGIKISLLDAQSEMEMRGRLPQGVRMYTGDDFHYCDLIAGDGKHHSDALLGIFDAIAPAASAAIQALDAGNTAEFHRILDPTLPLSRHIFEAPTYLYKTGIVFLAWLNGHQEHFRMIGGMESARSISHLSKLLVLAEQAGLLKDPELACHRMQAYLSGAGVAHA